MKKDEEKIMERTKERLSFRKKFIGDRRFYMMVLAVAVPIMIQNGITNFVSLLDNMKECGRHSGISYGWL